MNIHLTDFDESERADYMTVVASMAAVDGVISSEELLCLRELCKNFVLGPSARGQVLAAASSPPHDFEDIVRRLGHSSLRYSLLVDVAGMAFRDDVITDEERKEYKRLSDLMGVSECSVHKPEMVDGMLKGAEGLREVRALIGVFSKCSCCSPRGSGNRG